MHVKGASLEYDGAPLFADLDMDLEAGRWTCVLGPSGVGKTSLLRMIAGLAAASAGTSITADGGARLDGMIAYMAQQDLLLPWRTSAENVALGASLRRQPMDRERARALLSRVGLDRLAGQRPATLSGGQRQRVALARTLMEDRPVVLMDEPFSALDAITRSRLQDLAAELLVGRTVLLITHDPLEALRLGHRIHVMAGRPAELDEALLPQGDAPRDPADPRILRLQGELLSRLRSAGGELS
ncbi:MAG: ABC transporter ATP-binding protein [Alphaproteobacteria bacterium]